MDNLLKNVPAEKLEALYLITGISLDRLVRIKAGQKPEIQEKIILEANI